MDTYSLFLENHENWRSTVHGIVHIQTPSSILTEEIIAAEFLKHSNSFYESKEASDLVKRWNSKRTIIHTICQWGLCRQVGVKPKSLINRGGWLG